MDELTVVLAADDNFAMALAVAAFSVIATLSPRRLLNLCVLDMGISQHHRRMITTTLAHDRVTLRWVDSLAGRVRHLPNTWTAISRATYARLYLPEVLPESDRALYLDCDVLARRCVGELYDIDMAGSPAMGVPDVQSPFVCSPHAVPWWFRAGRSADEPNINCGVLLLDLKMWREESLAQEMLAYLTDGRHEFGQDQEAINVILGGRLGLLDPRWNQQSEFFDKIYEVTLPYDTETLANLREDPWIVHFSNARKPWQYGCRNPRLAEWNATCDQTAFAGRRRPSLPGHVVKRARRVPRWALSNFREQLHQR